MKCLKCFLITVLLCFAGCVVYASADTVTFKGITEPYSLVSFLLTTSDADFADLSEDDIIRTEIVTADEEGNFSQSFELKDVQYDNNGKITNYKLKSNIKNIDINSGIMNQKISITETRVEGDVVYVPVLSAFESLGITLSYDSAAKTYTGSGNNGKITIISGKDTFEVDYVTIELPGMVFNDGTKDWIPLYALEDAARIPTPRYDAQTQTAYVELPDPDQKPTEEFSIGNVVKTLTGTRILSQSRVYTNGSTTNSCNASIVKQKVSVSGQSFSDALHVEITYPNGYDTKPVTSDIRLKWTIVDGALPAGNVGVLSFKARALDIEGDTDTANIRVYVEKSNGTSGNGLFEKALARDVSIEKGDWQQFYLPVYHSKYQMDKIYTYFMIYAGGDPVAFEIADISLVNYGTQISYEDVNPDVVRPYKGMEDDALWRKEAYRRIDKYRKEDVTIQVNDASGNPIQNAAVSVDMTNNEFMFGVSLLKREAVGLDTSTKSGQIYNDLLDNDFNAAVCGLEMKQNGMLNTLGADAAEMANEFFARNIRLRGHAIFWDDASTVAFGDYNNMTYDEIYRKMMDYAGPVARMFKGKLEQWDVINEPTDSNHTRTTYNTTRLYTDLFNLIHKIDPDVKLYVNETGIEGSNGKYIGDRTVRFIDFVKSLKSEGAHVDGIGIQAHCVNYYYPQGFYNQLDACAQVVDEVSVTEYDLLNDNMSYADEHLRDTLTATFSHPKATAFIVWGVQDTEHWRRSATFYDSNWNEKDAKQMWSNLVNNEFATHETLVTDSNGSISLRAFRGDYNVKISVNGKNQTVPFKVVKDSDNRVVFTVGTYGISADASHICDTQIKTMDFANLDEARAEYENEYPEKYAGVLLDTNFRQAKNESAVLNGKALANSNYNNGKIWGSVSGVLNNYLGSDSDNLILCSGTSAYNIDLRHKIFEADRYPDTDLYFETMFETTASDIGGEYIVELCVSGDKTKSFAKIKYSNGGYYLVFPDETSYTLNRDTQYKIGILIKNNSNIAEYTLYNADKAEKSFGIACPGEFDIDSADEVIYTISSNVLKAENIFKLHNTRLCSTKDGYLILFSDSDRMLYTVDESLKNFDCDNIQYLNDASLNSFEGNEWVRTGGSYSTNGFKYSNAGQYLYTVIQNGGGTQSLIKNFEPVSDGESMTFEYNMYLNGAAKWYDLSGSGTVSLGSSDSDYKIDITSFYYDKYNGYKLKILNSGNSGFLATEDVHNGITGGYNWIGLTVSAGFVFDGNDSYDVIITIKDKHNNLLKTLTANGISQDKVKSLNRIYITSYSQYSSAGELEFCGLKNIRILKSGLTILNGEYKSADDNTSLGIMYENVTGRTHSANVVAAAYKDNKMINVSVFPCTIGPGVGSLNFNMGDLSRNADYCKIILIDGLDHIRPYIKSEIINFK